jgi:hypothetical protein
MYKFKKSAKQVTATTNVNNSLNYMREKIGCVVVILSLVMIASRVSAL